MCAGAYSKAAAVRRFASVASSAHDGVREPMA